jgi:hypothetical protein
MQAYASDLQNSPFINPAGPVWELHFADERAPWHASCPKLSQPWLRTVCAGHSIRIASFTRRLIRAGTHRCTAASWFVSRADACVLLSPLGMVGVG